MNFEQFIIILLARKKTIFTTLVSVVITVTVLSFLWPKTYTAETAIVVDVKTPDPVLGMLSGALLMPGYMATQVDIITSEHVARRVVKMMNFDKVPELVKGWQDDTGGRQSIESYYGNLLNKNLVVTPSREGNVITIGFNSSDPKSAAAVANAFAQAYIETNLDLLVEPAKQYSDWFAGRAKQVLEKLQKAQDVLSDAQKEKGIVSVDDRLSVENARLTELSSQLTVLEAQRSDARSRQRAASGDIATNPDVMNNPVIQNLRMTISAAEGKLQESSNQLGQNNPQVKEQRAGLDELKGRLQHEMDNVAASLTSSTQISAQKEGAVRAALEAQKKYVLNLKKQHDDLANLTLDVTTAQRDYDSINQRMSQTNLQSLSQQTNITVLTRAEEPLRPSSPRKFVNVLLSVFMGLLLGIGIALLKEKNDGRIYSKENLADIGIPVLGILVAERSAPSRWMFWRRMKTVH